ncbi:MULTISPECIES: leucyl/phenylalanyl-tRNA--protein transferase [Methylococcus]|jgi:leucyl/phenylalanyl-tRNA--protein transferase|uniref:Leucyl/phenylalanyl-tRNA--protein transferase n=3 Tax=Methylococcus capsulatus TaxID=414 RepID=LFTR_METCA|nr:leucyl/phenylalanyl-tRNA--protein transferase [Methylococcus capsulatus]Q607G8.1 RecName: Full=Leucyl/phenylalanyl-tRNA--protein transferase; AltName: Full=L/F-transferase; AltName: Full=Leucyltransferase; AltName: Full=Phenyalanyltransferase [Methylococcus capsulatus str. Bath]AAU92195.1 leucyl/phenylalanyl-tRNA--protein transferase [Methylococcus capsulatus str. Bath]QXP87559.1 leucyl/phenylalanyl-tRNA--protein transferase [Methylococcus capsulatus]QXP92701.1 leucyl/phenylalanyl-tRNA--prot
MLTLIDPNDERQAFPPPDAALKEPNGLLAVGGSLSVARLERAYRRGIFPWYGEGDPILWWSPDPRLVLFPEKLRISRSLRKTLRRRLFRFSFDRAFRAVITACAERREKSEGTWLTADMQSAYLAFHHAGFAHSFEAWQDGALVGGLYGVAMGRIFYGESMFHRVTDASKAALAFAVGCLSHWGYRMIDCQVYSSHLVSLGASTIPRSEFQALVSEYSETSVDPEAWKHAPGDFL